MYQPMVEIQAVNLLTALLECIYTVYSLMADRIVTALLEHILYIILLNFMIPPNDYSVHYLRSSFEESSNGCLTC